MNAADLARLEVAKRAYQATAPSDAEVQIGVRRARLALTRPKRRRNWFSRGLVFVVLAVGSLAYAKPHAIAEIVEKVLPREDSAKRSANAGTAASDAVETNANASANANAKAKANTNASANANASADTDADAQTKPHAGTDTDADANTNANASLSATARQLATDTATATRGAVARKKAATAARLTPSPALPNPADAPGDAASAQRQPDPSANAASATTDWGRVGQALARGDDTEALSALSQLSTSDDQRTRDKADMGRAQLLVAHGDSAGCALARSLTHRRAGGSIERQAQLLLKSCGRALRAPSN